MADGDCESRSRVFWGVCSAVAVVAALKDKLVFFLGEKLARAGFEKLSELRAEDWLLANERRLEDLEFDSLETESMEERWDEARSACCSLVKVRGSVCRRLRAHILSLLLLKLRGRTEGVAVESEEGESSRCIAIAGRAGWDGREGDGSLNAEPFWQRRFRLSEVLIRLQVEHKPGKQDQDQEQGQEQPV